MHELISVVAGVAIIQLILFTMFLWFSGKRGARPQTALIAFLAVNIAFLTGFFITWEFEHSLLITFFARVLFTTGWFFGPALYAYLCSLTFDKKITLKMGYATILFAAAFYLMIQIVDLFHPGILFIGSIRATTLTMLFLHIQIFYFMVLSLKRLNAHRIHVLNFYSNLGKHLLNWFRVIVYAFIAMWFIDFCSLLGNIFFQIPAAINIVMTFVSISINAVFANLTIFNGLQYPHLFLHKEEEPKQTTAESSLPPFNVEALKKKLTDAMQLHKLYLDPGITLGLLSVKSGINTKYLSQLINEHMGMNFYEFINSYRIKEAEKMLLSEEHAEKTILEILYTCGFNSKSVFNNVFKKATGITPTAYRRKKNFIYG